MLPPGAEASDRTVDDATKITGLGRMAWVVFAVYSVDIVQYIDLSIYKDKNHCDILATEHVTCQ